MRFDLERIIDDFVFFCFFIGNDFLPSLSALDISEGSLDHLINFYKKSLPSMKVYIVDKLHKRGARLATSTLKRNTKEILTGVVLGMLA